MRANSSLDLCQSALLGDSRDCRERSPFDSVIRRWVGAEGVDKFMVMPFVVAVPYDGARMAAKAKESAVLNTAFSGCVGLTRTVTESPTAWSGVDEPTTPST